MDDVRRQNFEAVFVVMCGLPASGKSFFSQILKRTLLDTTSLAETSVLFVRYDILIPEIKPDHWKAQRREVLEALSDIIRASRQSIGKDRVEKGHYHGPVRTSLMEKLILEDNGILTSCLVTYPVVLILDDNMYYKSMRLEVYQSAIEMEAGYCEIFLDVGVPVAKERNSLRHVRVREDVIDRMAQVIEYPGTTLYQPNCGFCRVKSPWTDLEMNATMNTVLNCLHSPLRPSNVKESAALENERIISKQRNQENVYHFADLFLRNLVKEQLCQCDKANMELVNGCRKVAFQNLKKLDATYLDLELNREFLQCFLIFEFEKALKLLAISVPHGTKYIIRSSAFFGNESAVTVSSSAHCANEQSTANCQQKFVRINKLAFIQKQIRPWFSVSGSRTAF